MSESRDPTNDPQVRFPVRIAYGVGSIAGTFIAVTTFTGKTVSGFGNFLGGILLDVIDFPVGSVRSGS